MYVFGVVGPGARELVDRVVAARPDERIARVDCTGRSPDGGALDGRPRAATTYERDGEGWRVRHEDLPVVEVLDRLAPTHDHAVLEGCPGADVPQVVLGDADYDGDVLLSASDPASVDPDAVLAAASDREPHETLESLVQQVKESPKAPLSGAIATFTGRVRAKEGPDDDPTEFLEFEKYEGVAEERMDAISAELEEREGVLEVVMHHRTGVIEYGRDIVFVVVLAGHRREAFRTVEDGIDRLKEEVPIFKKEVTVDEEFWVHDRE